MNRPDLYISAFVRSHVIERKSHKVADLIIRLVIFAWLLSWLLLIGLLGLEQYHEIISPDQVFNGLVMSGGLAVIVFMTLYVIAYEFLLGALTAVLLVTVRVLPNIEYVSDILSVLAGGALLILISKVLGRIRSLGWMPSKRDITNR